MSMATAPSSTLPDTPTERWLSAIGPALPALTGPAASAERLLLLLHYGVDWRQGWVTKHRKTYWDDILPNRVIAATYRSITLRRWWSEVSAALESVPRSSAERAEVATLLGEPSLPVLDVLRTEAEALTLRTRIVAEHVRATREDQQGEDQ